jgi:DNA polymerase-1
MLASYLIDPNRDHGLGPLALDHLSLTVDEREQLLGTGKKAALYEAIECDRAAAWAAKRCLAALMLREPLERALDGLGERALMNDIELPLSHVLAVVEEAGIRIDVHQLRELGTRVEEQLHGIEDDVRKQTGSDVNLGSPKQLQELLFVKLGLPAVKKTKTGLSTDAEVLEELAPLHPVAAKILEHRVLAKLKGTYIDTLPHLVDARTGRLHTSFRQTVAATGRLSSTDPNLQNVPIRTELGREIRRAFIAAPGHLLVVADYSQIELRVLAHLSSDPVLTDAFRKDEDVHERTVAEMFGEERRSDPDMRRVAKMINYGIVYGLSDFGLAQRLGIDRADAKRYIEGYLRTYAGLARYMEGLIVEARSTGMARTLLGRVRPIPELKAQNRNVRMYGERIARNTPIQGTAADLLKLAMIAVQRMLDQKFPSQPGPGPRSRMLLTVHDELVLEAPEDRAEAVGASLVDAMQGVMALSVPLKVDVGIGSSWADAK